MTGRVRQIRSRVIDGETYVNAADVLLWLRDSADRVRNDPSRSPGAVCDVLADRFLDGWLDGADRDLI